MPRVKTILIDFDGVIHRYSKGWQDGTIYDEPVPGSFSFLRALLADDRFQPAIYSSRSRKPGGVKAMQQWLFDWGMGTNEIESIQWPRKKQAAWLTIDDRCFLFRGEYPSLETIDSFRSWAQPGDG